MLGERSSSPSSPLWSVSLKDDAFLLIHHPNGSEKTTCTWWKSHRRATSLSIKLKTVTRIICIVPVTRWIWKRSSSHLFIQLAQIYNLYMTASCCLILTCYPGLPVQTVLRKIKIQRNAILFSSTMNIFQKNTTEEISIQHITFFIQTYFHCRYSHES